MSRSNNTDIKNPAVKFFQWSGGEGQIKYYDKETKENVFVDLPFTFLVLDRLVTISGYSDEDQCGLWSNEIRNTKKETLTVRTKAGIKRTGYYDEIKTINGAKFAQSLYIAFFDDDKQLKIGNFKLTGCAVSAWIEFCKGKDIYKGAIKIVASQKDKKGATTFYAPVFEAQEALKPTTEETAMQLDEELQGYLRAYFAMRGAEPEKEALSGSDYIEARNAEIAQHDEQETTFAEHSADDDSSIPF